MQDDTDRSELKEALSFAWEAWTKDVHFLVNPMREKSSHTSSTRGRDDGEELDYGEEERERKMAGDDFDDMPNSTEADIPITDCPPDDLELPGEGKLCMHTHEDG